MITPYEQVHLIFGGSFNPIHYGHLNALLQTAYQLPIAKITLVPCGRPPHKDTGINQEHQVNMLQLAIDNSLLPYPINIETHEIKKQEPSYTVHTLQYFIKELSPQIPLVLLLGMDSYVNFTQWFEWEHILKLCHLAILPRSPYTHLSVTNSFLLNQETNDYKELLQNKHGKIWHAKPTINLNISSTQLRDAIKQKKKPLFLLPDAVLNYILKNNLYCI